MDHHCEFCGFEVVGFGHFLHGGKEIGKLDYNGQGCCQGVEERVLVV